VKDVTDHQFTVSGFADEIGSDLDEQLDVLKGVGIDHLDLRGVEGTNVLNFSDEQAERIRNELDDHGVGVTSIGSPIGKIGIEESFEPHLDRFEDAIEAAKTFDAEYIRMFSYYIPEDDDPADHREAVLRRTRETVKRAEEAGVTLLHENEKDIYGDTPGRCRDLLTTIDSPAFRAIFDPANFLEVGVQPYPDALLDVIEYVEQLHVKDAQFGERGAIEPAGEGDGEIPATLEALQRRGFDGPASLEPHLTEAGPAGGYSGPEGYRVAARALFDCFEETNANYT
jgi:sugar phosphate isomerase/epimerase